jgi:hypothetical protein
MKEGLEQVILRARADAVTELYICCDLRCDGMTFESFKCYCVHQYIRVCKVQVKSLCFFKNCTMKAFVGVEVLLQEFLNSALGRAEWSASQSARFAAGAHWVGGRIGPSLVSALRRGAESFVCCQKLKPVSSFVQPVV